jgi:hypothetical protein
VEMVRNSVRLCALTPSLLTNTLIYCVSAHLNLLKNAVFWDVTPCGSGKNRRFGESYRLHHQDKNRRDMNNISSVRFEVFTAVTMKDGVFWVVTPCGRVEILRSVRRLLVAACVVPSSPILSP